MQKFIFSLRLFFVAVEKTMLKYWIVDILSLQINIFCGSVFLISYDEVSGYAFDILFLKTPVKKLWEKIKNIID